MNNRNRGPERERSRGNRYSASGQDVASGRGQAYGSGRNRDNPSSHLGGRQGMHDEDEARYGSRYGYGNRDIQGAHSAGGQYGRLDQGREGSYPQSSMERYGSRDEESGFAGSQHSQYRDDRGYLPGAERERAMSRAGRGHAGGYQLDRDFDDQQFSQEYSQGSSHYGSQGFGAQGSQGVYGPQGFGPQGGIGARGSEYGGGYSSSGGYSQEGHGGPQGWREHSGASDAWRAGNVTGQGYGERSGRYRGLGPKNYKRSDERIREDLNERLTDSDEIDASGISVDVSNGVATLTGTVEQRWMKHRAEDLAEACGGVRDVNNQIRVQPSQPSERGSAASTASGTSAGLGGGASTQSTASSASGHGVGSTGSSGSAGATRSTGSSGTTPA